MFSYVKTKKVVTPAKAGVQSFCNGLVLLDAGFRRYDGCGGIRLLTDSSIITVIAVKIPPLAMLSGCWGQGAEENGQDQFSNNLLKMLRKNTIS
jgi:hypothetical protein